MNQIYFSEFLTIILKNIYFFHWNVIHQFCWFIPFLFRYTDQNFYFNQGRFTPSFQNPRNGFFPTSADTSSSSFRQQPLQQQQQRYQTIGGSAQNLFLDDDPSADDTTQGYYHQQSYSAFPVRNTTTKIRKLSIIID